MTGSPGLASSPLYGPVFSYSELGLTVPFTKPYRTIEESLDILERRGLAIPDREHARRCLGRIGYYRLSAYWYPFRKLSADSSAKKRHDEFRAEASFDDVLRFYLFDKALRLELSDALERIEIAVRACLVDVLGVIDPLSYRDSRTYTARFNVAPEVGETPLEAFIAGLDETFRRSQEEYAKHFRAEYDHPPPIWIAVGTWDWGKLSHAINHLSDGNRDALCYAIDPRLTRRALVSWMRCLNEVRNACAHHSRLWNKALINSPRLQPSEIADFVYMADETGKIPDDRKKRIYGALMTVNYLMRIFHPNTEWPRRLGELIDKAGLPAEVGLGSAGFPDDWRQDPLWQQTQNGNSRIPPGRAHDENA